MREIVRPVTAALGVACLALAMTAASSSGAFAQAKQQQQQQMAPAAKPAQAAPPAQAAAPAQDQAPPIKQIALTDKQVDGAIAAAKEMDPITAKLSQDAKPDPKVVAQLEAIAKKNGFASYDEYNSVVDNISLVLGGFDPQTKKYVGPRPS